MRFNKIKNLQSNRNEIRLAVYKDISENLRHYGNMRFAQLTLFFIITGGLFTAAFNERFEISSYGELFIYVAGIISTLVIWIMETSSTNYWCHYKEQAKNIEISLGISQYNNNKSPWYLSATYAVALLFFSVFIFWAFLLFKIAYKLIYCASIY